jgi:ubiquinone/menaquinone biosynthesis C-methylase UbiE
MNQESRHYTDVAAHYDRLADNGPFATLAPHNRGGRKAEYVAAVFDVAIMGSAAKHAPYTALLDFGCGTGIFSRQAAAMANHVVGVDVSERMLGVAAELCQHLSNVTLLQTDGEKLALPDGSFDCVVARESLCYVTDDRLPLVLSEINRVLKPDGVFYWLEQVSDNPSWQRHPNVQHLVKRSPDSLRNFARAAGLSITEESMVRTPRFPWIYVIWLGLVPRGWIPVLARWEVAWHEHFGGGKRRWWNTLFVLRKVP